MINEPQLTKFSVEKSRLLGKDLGGGLLINAKALKMDMARNYSAGIIFVWTVGLYITLKPNI